MYRGTLCAGLDFFINSWKVVLLTGGGAESTLDGPRPPYGGVFLRGAAARLDDMNVQKCIAWICLSGLVAGCDGAPSRNILGSYFPSWMVCALVGIVVALVARAVLKATGLLEELPAPLLVLLGIGCAVDFGMWLVWLA